MRRATPGADLVSHAGASGAGGATSLQPPPQLRRRLLRTFLRVQRTVDEVQSLEPDLDEALRELDRATEMGTVIRGVDAHSSRVAPAAARRLGLAVGGAPATARSSDRDTAGHDRNKTSLLSLLEEGGHFQSSTSNAHRAR